jgi:hypothetical protein
MSVSVARATEGLVEYIRASREVRHALVISDRARRPFDHADHRRPAPDAQPLLVLLALAFWTWMWGPFGAFLAVPLSIIGLVAFNHLFPNEDVKLPE